MHTFVVKNYLRWKKPKTLKDIVLIKIGQALRVLNKSNEL